MHVMRLAGLRIVIAPAESKEPQPGRVDEGQGRCYRLKMDVDRPERNRRGRRRQAQERLRLLLNVVLRPACRFVPRCSLRLGEEAA
jgi:hypothetical protein